MSIKAVSISILSLYLQGVYAYIPAHLDKIKQADECLGCDFTQLLVRSWDKFDINATNLKNSLWTKATLSNNEKIDFSSRNLENTNFVLSRLYKLKFNNSIMDNANFSASDFFHCSLNNTSLISGNFSKSQHEISQFTHANLSHVNFEQFICRNCNFMFADLDKASFSGAEMRHANFYGSNISQEQLNSMKSYDCATLPDGRVYDKNGEINCDY